MKWEDHRSWVLGAVAGFVIAIVSAVFSVVYAAYYNRTHRIAEWGAIGSVINTPVPLWSVFLVAVAVSWSAWKGFSLWRRSESKVDTLKHRVLEVERELGEIKSLGPKLHGVWNVTQSFWHLVRKGNDPSMQIGGWISLSSSGTDEIIHLLAAYIGDQRSDTFIPVVVKPDVLQDDMVMLYMTPPLTDDVTHAFTATIVVEDHKNRKYKLPTMTFRPTGQTPPVLTGN